jgi:hypothetical protein
MLHNSNFITLLVSLRNDATSEAIVEQTYSLKSGPVWTKVKICELTESDLLCFFHTCNIAEKPLQRKGG